MFNSKYFNEWRWNRFILISAGILAIILRLFHLNYQSFWHDEILSLLLSEGTWTHILTNSYLVTNVSPLFYLIIKPFTVLPDPEFMTRLPSAVFGILSLYYFYKLLSMLSSPRVARIAVVLMCFSSFHIWYSQEMRPYNLLILLGLISLFLFLKIHLQEKQKWWVAGFIFATAAVFYCHTLGIAFVGFLYFAALLYSPREKWLSWTVVFALIGVLLIPGIWELASLPKLRSADSFRSFQLLSLPYSFWVFLTGYSLGPSVSELHTHAGMTLLMHDLVFIIPIGLTFGIITVYALSVYWKSDRKLFIFILLWLTIPGFFALLGSIFSNQPFNTRYIILIFPALLLLWAKGIEQLPHKSWRVVCLSLFIGINCISLYNYYFNPRYAKEDNRTAAAYFKKHASPNDLAICSAFYAKKGLEYYARHPNENLIGYRPDKHENRAAIIFSDLSRIIGKHQSFWLYLSRNFNKRQVELIRKYCDTNYVRALDKRFNGVELTFYKKAKLITRVHPSQ